MGRLTRALATHHGHLGRALVEQLVATSAHGRWELAAWHDRYVEALDLPEKATELERSWSKQIGTALAAIEVTAQLCPELCPDVALWKSTIHTVWNELREHLDNDGRDVVEVVWEKTVSWLAQARAHLLPSPSYAAVHRHDNTVREPVGRILDAENEGHENEVFRRVEVFPAALTAFLEEQGYSPGALVPELGRRGHIETTEASRNARS